MSSNPATSIYAAAGHARNVDPLLLQAIARVESGENDSAVGQPTRWGQAKGRMQFIDATARRYGVQDPHDPGQAVPAAAAYIDDLLTRHGSVPGALMAYSGGDRYYPLRVAAAYDQLRANSGNATGSPSAQGGVSLSRAPSERGPNEPPARVPNSTPSDRDLIDAFIAGPSGARRSATPSPSGTPTTLPQAEHPSGAQPTNTGDADFLIREFVAGPAGQQSPVPKRPGEQYMEAAPDTPMTRWMQTGSPPSTTRPASVVTQAAAGMAQDPEQRMRIVASRLFPNLPLTEAMARITTDDRGRLIAVDDQARAFYVDPPALFSPQPPYLRIEGMAPGNLARNVAGAAGSSLPVIGAAAGGLAGAPGSMVTAPIGAAIGGGVGDAIRQTAARALDPKPDKTPYDIGQTAEEMALSGAGQAAGGLLARALAPNPLRLPQSDIRLARTEGRLPAAAAAYANAGQQGVNLTPGQASGLPTLLGYEDAIRISPGYSDRALDFYRRQGGQVQEAGRRFLGALSPVDDSVDAALAMQQAASTVAPNIRAAANETAARQYAAAHAAGNVMTPELAQLIETPSGRQALARAREIYLDRYGIPPETPDFQLWNETKKVLDDMYNSAMTSASSSAGRAKAAGIDTVRRRLVENLDAAYPTFAEARQIVAPGQSMAARLEAGVTGKIGRGDGDETAPSVLKNVFERQNARAISEMRDAFVASGKEDEWNAGLRGYLQTAINQASQRAEGLNASMLLRNVWGKTEIKDAMQAAMSGPQFKGFENFMSMLENVSRTYPTNSLTAARMAAREGLDNAASNTTANRIVRLVGALGSPQTYLLGARTLTDPIDKAITERNLSSIVDRLFSGDGMRMLEQMSRLPPTGTKSAEVGLQFLSRALVPGALAGVGSEEEPSR